MLSYNALSSLGETVSFALQHGIVSSIAGQWTNKRLTSPGRKTMLPLLVESSSRVLISQYICRLKSQD